MTGVTLRKYRSHKRYSFSRTFGATTLLTDCEFDTGLANFNQNEPNPVTGEFAMPNGCTAFARTDIAMNEDRILYKPGFTYEKSCLIENVPMGSALLSETAFKSGVVYGLQAIGEDTDAQALSHRRGPYFEVDKSHDDWFDSLWSALLVGKKGLSAATMWYPELTMATTIDSVIIRPTDDGHDWEITGVTTQNGIPRMHVKWWGGEPKWFGRAAINALLSAQGSDCLTDVDGKATPADIQTVRLTIMQTLISYMQRLLSWYKTQQTEGALEVNQVVMNPDDVTYPWDTQKHIYHNVRVMCDLAGLTVDEKNKICACIYQESRFNPAAINHNKNSAGVTLSTDYGICQINDFYHIGPGKEFPSVPYVLANPKADVAWMISMYQHGLLKQWVSYSSGAYKEWLVPTSPMWALAS